MKPKFKAPGTKRLKQKYDVLLSSFAFNFNVRRYSPVQECTTECRGGFGKWSLCSRKCGGGNRHRHRS